jgi:hypothetical protein
MERFKIIPLVLSFALIVTICAPIGAQTGQPLPETPLKIKPVPANNRQVPFDIERKTPKSANSVEFRKVDQMAQKDRDLEASSESSIGARAEIEGLEFKTGKWSYRQLVCPALPNHLFLLFTRDDGPGDISVFSASVPRGNEGRVRIIPIQRRGYSLFSPASVNALTVSVFNHIRAEEHSDKKIGWLGTGLCYAALAGANPQVTTPTESSGGQDLHAGTQAVMQIPIRGGAVIRFIDGSAIAQPMEWILTFNGEGTLLKVTKLPAATASEKRVPTTPVNVQGKPVPEPAADLKGKPVQ